MKTTFLVLVVLALIAVTIPAQVYDMQTAGQVAVHSKPGTFVATNRTSWVPLPAMKGAITLPIGGDLAVSLTLDGNVTGTSDPALYVRVKIDGIVVSPTVIRLLRGGVGRRSASVTFFKAGLSAGPHRVEAEWSVSSGAYGTAYARSLIMRFARSDSPRMRIAQAQGTSLTALAGGYSNMPGMSVSLNLPWDGRLAINVTGEFLSFTSTKDVFIRAVVDSKVYQDVLVSEGPSEGTRSFTFNTPKLTRGNHTVTIQWSRQATAMALFPIVTVTGIIEAVNYKTGFLYQTYSGPNLATTSTTFAGVPNVGGNIFVPSRTDLAIRFSAEATCTGGALSMVRARVNGKVADPGEVGLGASSGLWGTREAVFIVRNVERGWYNIALDWRLFKTGGKGYLGDRNLTVTAVSGQRPLLVAAMESTRPTGYKFGGTFSSAVVEVKSSQRVFRSFVNDNLFRANPGVADWFLEQSRGHMFVVEAGVVGPGLKKYNEKYYREQVTNPFTAMKHEALQNADKTFDFSLYDRNGDGKVTKDELYAVVVLYQDSVFGEVRSIPVIASNDGVTIDYTGGIATVYTPDFRNGRELPIFYHELSHLLLNAGDMYETSYDPTAPGPYSIMDQDGWGGHLDPLHKLKSRWYESYGQAQDRYLILPPVSKGGSLVRLHDPKSHTKEYFLVENRAGINYNAKLPARGLAVWHIDESRMPNYRTAVEIEPASGYTNPNRYENYLFRGTAPRFSADNDIYDDSGRIKTRWHDNKRSGIGVWAIERMDDGSGNMRIFVDVPGPGVLVEMDGSTYTVAPDGWQTIRLRIVNTDFTADSFDVTVKVSGGSVNWTGQRHALGGYQQKILLLRVRPTQHQATVTITAKGIVSGATTSDSAIVRAPLSLVGTPKPGTFVTLAISDPPEANKWFAMGASLGTSPGISLGSAGVLPLNPDVIFFASQELPTVFANFRGRLNSAGAGQSRVNVPNDNRIIGLSIYCAFITHDTAIRDISNAVKLKIQ